MKTSLMIALLAGSLLSASASVAQTRGAGANDAGGGCTCPNPINIHIAKKNGSTT